ncbi:MBL fold metallo-hydrolase [Gloeocapsa sp. PCC 73106]|uniref:MBL fold metallo-hydrolase n=1 Tax=Gloeocapsa sp. PCC 73106 TaxID=102232 RepID=UPI0002ACC989|nr:MBL fold metallo-hydrolase [Gloeocapsa sp. PCC 73106]ELR97798.1 Zn-dependent hydrolase, glyoxylase [Gloeocapsa sp. PCC 73106]
MFGNKLNFIFGVIISTSVLVFISTSNVFAYLSSFNNNSEQPVTVEHLISQANYDAVEIKTIPVRENIYMLIGEGGNIGVSTGEDGALLIDSQFAPLTAKIEAAVKAINPQAITYLINTHYHFDHTGGNENLAKLGVKIIAHDNVSKQMSIPHTYAVLGMETPAQPQEALPVVTFSQSMNLELNGNQVYAFHIPLAHTDGDVIIQFKDKNVIHAGDIYFQGMYPFIDTEVGGSVAGMISAVDQILPLCNEETLIIPGHGNLSNCQELGKYQEMLKTVNQRVEDGIAQQMSLEDLIAGNILADLDEKWGKGFLKAEQFITIAYQGMKK